MTAALETPLATALLALAALAAVAATLLFARRVAPGDGGQGDDIVRRVARNSLVPIASQALIRGSDLVVAIALLRLLGPEGNGQYGVAVVVWLYLKTLSDFGLSLLATGDIARDRSLAGQIVGETTLLRWLVLALSAVPVGVYALAGVATGTLSTASVLAIALLYASIVPASYAEAMNSALNGLERMAVGALINIGVSLFRAPVAVALAVQFGVTGVAAAAVVAAAFSAELYRRVGRRAGVGSTRWTLTRGRGIALARRSWPLLVNALLVNLFFRVDVFIVQAARGDEALGRYDAAYKLINLVTIVPAYVTLAMFPAMARQADAPGALERTLRLATSLLVWLGWGVVVVVSALAGLAIRALAGAEYMPEAATLLRILIWFAPISFVNGVIQYALVATEQQRRVVPAFGVAVATNLALNLAFVPAYGARAAAFATVVTEIAILAAFLVVLRRSERRVVTPATLGRLWRPSLAGLGGAGAALALAGAEWLAAPGGTIVFFGLSFAFGVFGEDERELLRRAWRRAPAPA